MSARRPRLAVGRDEAERVVERFRSALVTGDLPGLLEMLASDVELVADGGGIAPTVRIPLSGADVVGQALTMFHRRAPEGAVVAPMRLNGAPGLRIDFEGALDTAVSVVVEDGRITGIYAVRNPEKLARLGEEARLSRTVG